MSETNIFQLKTRNSTIEWKRKESEEEVPVDLLLFVAIPNEGRQPGDPEFLIDTVYKSPKTGMYITIPGGSCLNEVGDITHYAVIKDPAGAVIDLE